MTTPEGWYPDPGNDPALERYWDGGQWTHNTRPIGGQEQAQQAQQEQQMQGQHAVAQVQAQQQVMDRPADNGAQDQAQNGAAQAQDAAGQAAAQAQQMQAQQQAQGQQGQQAQQAQQAQGQQGQQGQQHPQQGQQASGVAGIHTELLTESRYSEIDSSQRVVKQNSRLLKVVLGEDVFAKQGAMVAYQGQVDFKHEGSGAAKFAKKMVTGEGVSLMRCSGQGEVFFAKQANQVHIIHLEGAGLTVNGSSILAFEPSLSWDVERVKGAAMAAGGMFNTRLQGTGWVAITTDGDPVVLNTNQPTFVDTDAVVAWSSNLQTKLNSSMKASSLIGRGSGEAVQLALQGNGIVIVQPSEGIVFAPA